MHRRTLKVMMTTYLLSGFLDACMHAINNKLNECNKSWYYIGDLAHIFVVIKSNLSVLLVSPGTEWWYVVVFELGCPYARSYWEVCQKESTGQPGRYSCRSQIHSSHCVFGRSSSLCSLRCSIGIKRWTDDWMVFVKNKSSFEQTSKSYDVQSVHTNMVSKWWYFDLFLHIAQSLAAEFS